LAHFLLATILSRVTVLGQAASHNRKEQHKKVKAVVGDSQEAEREDNWKLDDTTSLTVAKRRWGMRL
jgi:hypothetical protein